MREREIFCKNCLTSPAPSGHIGGPPGGPGRGGGAPGKPGHLLVGAGPECGWPVPGADEGVRGVSQEAVIGGDRKSVV